MEQIVEQSFTEIDLCSAVDGQVLVDFASLKYAIDGKAVTFNLYGKNSAILANIKNLSYAGLDGEYRFMVCGEQAETAFAYYGVELGISYRAHSYLKNGESQGTFTYQFN